MLKLSKQVVDFINNEYINDLLYIISNKNIKTVFQPIIDLYSGNILGYEALSRIIGPSIFSNIGELFEKAQKFNLTNELEAVCREKSIVNAKYIGIIDASSGIDPRSSDRIAKFPKGFLSLNISPSLLAFPLSDDAGSETLLEEIEDYRDSLVLEMTERFCIENESRFSKTVDEYKRRGFRIAIDDLGAGYAGLQLLANIEPFMVKIDRSIIAGIQHSTRKRLLLESLVSFCRKINARVVAEGIETYEELETVVALKVDCGQGFFLAKPEAQLQTCSEEALYCILNNKNSNKVNAVESNCAGSLARFVQPVTCNESVDTVATMFRANDELRSVPVLEGQLPIGIIHKSEIFYKLGQRFGYDLLSRKSVSHVVEDALVFEFNTPIEEVSRKTLERDLGNIYDDIIVVRNGGYCGIVKVYDLLDKITQQKVNLAIQANPLTGLPGNNLIKNEIVARLDSNQLFSVLYFDLDNFKPFNDNFGFEQGDNAIRLVGNILKDVVVSWDRNSFLGHIGGDDFVVVCAHQGVEDLCEKILSRFEKESLSFYDPEIIDAKCYKSFDRSGCPRAFPLLSLSISVVSSADRVFESYAHMISVASEVKKKAKSIPGNSYYVDRRRK